MRELTIGDVRIADDTDPFVIAEAGHNHGGDMRIAEQMIRAAKDAGASAVKLQKRDNRTLFTKAFYDSPYNSENAYGPTYGLHREALEFDKEQYQELKAIASEVGILFFATAFDLPSVDFLANLKFPPQVIKIASGDLTNLPLIRYAAEVGVPLIISTGGGTWHDIDAAYDAAWPRHMVSTTFPATVIAPRTVLMQCTSIYPAPVEALNLSAITGLRARYPDNVIGYSGHDAGIAMPLVAWALGARVIEKHFTLNRTWKGSDQAWSLEPDPLRRMIRDLQRARVAMGDGHKRRQPEEGKALAKMEKVLVAARPLKERDVIKDEDVVEKTTGAAGIPPSQRNLVVGGTLMKDMAEEEPFDLNEMLPF